mmetsp:Transcript_138328/g.240520  ORF Transcript_138328/g.240520 Transcript_138328/m.240520 type:complete len:83 (+) Transcript_138328:4590-4838(+)
MTVSVSWTESSSSCMPLKKECLSHETCRDSLRFLRIPFVQDCSCNNNKSFTWMHEQVLSPGASTKQTMACAPEPKLMGVHPH